MCNEKMYKYVDAGGLLTTLENMSVRCNRAKNLNDVYDSTPPFICKEKVEDDSIYQNKRNNSFQGFVSEKFYEVFVTSFTKAGYDNLLMWGHYTNKYSGGVIEFNKKSNPILSTVVDINYSKEPIEVSPDFCYMMQMDAEHKKDETKAFSDLEKIYTTKHISWEYEQELRYFTHIPPDVNDNCFSVCGTDYKMHNLYIKKENDKIFIHVPITAQDISAIYIGNKMSTLDRLKLYSILREKNIDVPVKIMQPQHDKYQLNFIDNGCNNLRFIFANINIQLANLEDCRQPQKIREFINNLEKLSPENIFETSDLSGEDKKIAKINLDLIMQKVKTLKEKL